MKLRELIALLTAIGDTIDIREFRVYVPDADYQDLAPVTGVTWDLPNRTLVITTDDL